MLSRANHEEISTVPCAWHTQGDKRSIDSLSTQPRQHSPKEGKLVSTKYPCQHGWRQGRKAISKNFPTCHPFLDRGKSCDKGPSTHGHAAKFSMLLAPMHMLDRFYFISRWLHANSPIPIYLVRFQQQASETASHFLIALLSQKSKLRLEIQR